MKKTAVLMLAVMMLISINFVSAMEPEKLADAGTTVEELDLSAKSAVVMEEESGKIIYSKKKDLSLPPASVTKVMSLLLIFEELDQGKIKRKDPVTVSEHAASMGGSQVFLEPSEVQDVKTMIKCIVVSSANDATTAMAEHIAGSEGAFVKRMNEKARSLGMMHTHFKNCCGLDESGHVTSAYDIALMSRELIKKHPGILKYTKIWMDSFVHKTKKGQKEFGLSNTNKMLKQYQGCTGLKTGSTGKAKFCLSATATRNSMHMIAVVMASSDSKTRIKDASALLDYGFSNCSIFKDSVGEKDIGIIRVSGGEKESVQYDCPVTAKMTLVKKHKAKIKRLIVQKKAVAPVKKGDAVGTIIYKSDGKIIYKAAIHAVETVKKMNYLSSVKRIMFQYFH